MVRIGLNMVFVLPGQTGGIEIYANELIQALRARARGVTFVAFVNQYALPELDWLKDGIEVVPLPVYPRSRSGWVPGELTLLPSQAEKAGCDLVHSLASTGPATGHFKRITTVHDLIYRILPQFHRGLRYLGPKFFVSRILIPLAARASQIVIADSDAAARDIRRLLRLPQEKVVVVPMGPGKTRRAPPEDISVLRTRYDLGARPIALSVAAKWPHKNHDGLIRAVARLPAAERPVLVLPGYPTHHEDTLQHLAGSLGVADDVRFLGWVSESELEGLYAAATACVLPSFYEGFGLPVLEAMARGVPLACSRGGAMEDLAGDAALTFDPCDTDQIAAVLRRLLTESEISERLRQKALRRASCFSWNKAADATLRVYAQVLGTGSLM